MVNLSVPVSSTDHIAGSESAAVTLVEYGDYQCPDCGAGYVIVKKLQKHFGDKLRFVFRNFPLPMHQYAEAAAETAEYAAEQDQFWEMHDALFEHQDEFSDSFFGEIAKQLGLKTSEVKSAIEDEAYADKIEADVEGGEASKVHGTPTFFINGKGHEGSYDYETLRKAIESIAGKG